VLAAAIELDTPAGPKKFLVFLVLELGDMIGLHTRTSPVCQNRAPLVQSVESSSSS
jgi:hypothetical protein